MIFISVQYSTLIIQTIVNRIFAIWFEEQFYNWHTPNLNTHWLYAIQPCTASSPSLSLPNIADFIYGLPKKVPGVVALLKYNMFYLWRRDMPEPLSALSTWPNDGHVLYIDINLTHSHRVRRRWLAQKEVIIYQCWQGNWCHSTQKKLLS